MSGRTTIVLIFLVAVLGAVWRMFGDDEANARADLRLFPDLVVAEVVRARVAPRGLDVSPGAFSLVRGPDGWTLTAPEVFDGREVPALGDRVDAWIGLLRDAVAVRTHATAVDSAAEEGFGTDRRQGTLVELTSGDGTSVGLRVGHRHEPGGVLVQRSGADQVLEADLALRGELLPPPESLRDARVLPLRASEVRRIDVIPAAGLALALVWHNDRWFVEEPSLVPADARRGDELRGALLGLIAGGYEPSWPAAGEATTVKVTDAGGRIRTLVLAPGDHDAALVLLEDGSTVRCAGGILALLDRDPDAYRDRNLFPEPSSQVRAVRVTGEGVRLELERDLQSWVSVGPTGPGAPGPRRRLDPVDMGVFLERLRALQLAGFRAEGAGFESVLAVEVDLDAGAGHPVRTRRLELGPPDDSGLRPVLVGGMAGQGTVQDPDLAFLLQPDWKLAERAVGEARDYFKLRSLDLSDREGRRAVLKARLGPHRSLEAELIGSDGAGEAVPQELVDRLVQRICFLSVRDFVGDAARPGMGFDDPRYEVSWTEDLDGTAEGIVDPPSRPVSYTWTTGAKRADGLSFGIFFVVDDADLDPVRRLLEWAASR